MAENVNPRKGAKAAPTAAAAPRPVTLGPTVKSAPSNAPGVAHTKAPPANGDSSTPTSVASNAVDPIAPSRGSTDPHIGRTV